MSSLYLMNDRYLEYLTSQLADLRTEGLEKVERVIESPQDAIITLEDGRRVINLCANNYLGLANHNRVIESSHRAIDRFGYGVASVRFICGTQTLHTALEERISEFLGAEASILYSSCFDANTGLFETLLGEEDAIISDALNHASIIDGVRLCKAARYRYANNDMADLERQLAVASDARFRMIATDGVFSMDGVIADLEGICDLADRYDAMVMVDDSHAVGFVGERGAGTPELLGVEDRITLRTGTLGKALGGASGGYTAGPAPIIDWLRQRSRPYLFSNSLTPMIASTSLEVLDFLEESGDLRERLAENGRYFRERMTALGFTLTGADHPIIPVLLGDAKVATEMANRLLDEGVYVIGFSFPVVPRGQARIRTQMSAAHTRAHLDQAIEGFATVGRAMGVIS